MKKEPLFFHPKNDYTGSTRILANTIVNEYHNCPIYVVTDKNSNQGFLSELSNVRMIETWSPTYKKKEIKYVTFFCWSFYGMFLALFYGFKFRIFYINTTKPYYAAIIGWFLNKKIVYHVHEVFTLNSITTKIYRYFFDNTKSHRIFVSKYTKEQFKENPKCSWEIKYNKLSESFISAVKIRPIEERERNCILMISSMSRRKGVDNFINIASKLPKYKFVLVLSSTMDKIIDYFETKAPDNVSIIPAQSNIQSYLEKADILLNLSVPPLCIETFGMTILEAMPYAIPAIVPNIGGPTELVEDGYNGFCVDVTNIDAIIEAINIILDINNYQLFANNSLQRFRYMNSI